MANQREMNRKTWAGEYFGFKGVLACAIGNYLRLLFRGQFRQASMSMVSPFYSAATRVHRDLKKEERRSIWKLFVLFAFGMALLHGSIVLAWGQERISASEWVTIAPCFRQVIPLISILLSVHRKFVFAAFVEDALRRIAVADTTTEENRALAWKEIGQLHFAVGNNREALQYLRQGCDIVEKHASSIQHGQIDRVYDAGVPIAEANGEMDLARRWRELANQYAASSGEDSIAKHGEGKP